MIEENYPHWKQELKSSQNKEGKFLSNRWIQMATISKSNEPRLRTVVFREWIKDDSMIIFTDRRSEKVKDIDINNNVEILWILSKTKSQFRFKGNAYVIHDDNKYWNNLSEQSRSLWFWPTPGKEFNNLNFENIQIEKEKPINFMVFEIAIHTVELLKLERPFHKRYLWEKRKNWVRSRLNP
tara:strand:+ start:4879 stop:5424 length:546 start_codon:yes stop_codon:yes gene_type:complete